MWSAPQSLCARLKPQSSRCARATRLMGQVLTALHLDSRSATMWSLNICAGAAKGAGRRAFRVRAAAGGDPNAKQITCHALLGSISLHHRAARTDALAGCRLQCAPKQDHATVLTLTLSVRGIWCRCCATGRRCMSMSSATSGPRVRSGPSACTGTASRCAAARRRRRSRTAMAIRPCR